MLTIRGVYKDGQLSLLDRDRPPNDCQVVVTFLTDEENGKLLAGIMLTPHQRELLQLAQQGLRCRQIASALSWTLSMNLVLAGITQRFRKAFEQLG